MANEEGGVPGPQTRRGSGAQGIRLFLCGAAALYWELVLIRWLGSEIRIVAYFTNLVLISAFFGLGAGALLTRFAVRLERLIAPLLAIAVMLGPWLGQLWHHNPGGGDEYIWIGAPFGVPAPAAQVAFWSPALILVLVYLGVAAVFAAFGQYIGRLFQTQPPLRGYSIEIAGSLAGIVLFALLSRGQTAPTLWFAVGTGLVVAMLLARRTDAVLAALLGALTVAGTHPESARHVWSPYHRIAVEPITHIRDVHTREEVDLGRTVGYVLTVNSDYYQMMLDLDSDRPQHPFLAGWRAFYEQPYVGAETLPPGPVLVVGAGTGNDVAAALRRTHRPVTAVEIDPGIAALGIRLHPERPYSDPRVTLVIDDARSYFHHARSGEYALVVFGFLDSHRLLSAFSSVRLDNFVYTREGLEEARRLLAPGGRIALSFTSRRWMHERILALVTGTFGPGTTTWTDPSAYANGVLYVNARTPGAVRLPPPGGTLVPTDDWPFLYLQRRRIPAHNRLFLLIAISLSSACLLLLPRGERRIRLPYFFLGAAFFLIETSNVVRMALLYGTTWWVNTVVFAGILALVLLSNLTAARWPIPVRTSVVWAALLILLSALVPVQTLLELGPWSRGAVAVVVFLGPVYFGGLIFARLIRAEPRLFEAYGSNVLGAVLGGAAEYSSLVFGFRFLLAVALCLYLAVFLLLRRGGGVRGALAA